MRELLKAGADVNQANKKGTVPLKIATQGAHLQVVKELIRWVGGEDETVKVDLKAESIDGMTSLHMAAAKVRRCRLTSG